MTVSGFVSFTIAIILLFIGKELTLRFEILRRNSIPDPVLGGLLCAVVVGAIYLIAGVKIDFHLEVRDVLLLYFFAGIGLQSSVATLRSGGKPMLILAGLAALFILLQNAVGVSMAGIFGLNPKAGLMTGSIALTGGIGTVLAWGPMFVDKLQIVNAQEIGIAANMVGLISACVIGGPIAGYLMRRHQLHDAPPTAVAENVRKGEAAPVAMDYYAVLRAWLWLNIALLLGSAISTLLKSAGLNLPDFVGCLMAGIVLRNLIGPFFRKSRILQMEGARQGLNLISDICLGMFLTMALMGLRLWELNGVLLFVATTLFFQIALAILFTVFVVFRVMGRDYEAAVICSGFGGIALGSTATAVANMTAVSSIHGPAPRAFLVVPLVCGFFIDLVNAVVINLMIA